MDISPELSTPAILLAIPLLAALVIDPWFGKRLYRRLGQDRGRDNSALTRFYKRILLAEWACAAVVCGIIALSPGSKLADFGLALPANVIGAVPNETSELAGMAVGLLLAGVLLAIVFRKLAGTSALVEGWRAGLGTFEAMIPSTRTERRYAVAVSVTAGVCEELIYRGFLIAFGVGAFGLHPYVAGAVAVALFGVAHFYQGWSGMVRVIVFGIAMTWLYLSTGSLLLPIAIHAVGDIVSLVVMPRLLQSRTAQPAGPTQPAEAS